MTQRSTAAAVTSADAALRPVEIELPALRSGMVRVRVRAAGVCGADAGTIRAAHPKTGFPIVPGHEIAGVVAATAPDVTAAHVGDRVAVGWLGGSCGHCRACRAGDPVHCPDRVVPGVDQHGGWAQYVDVSAAALVRIPDGLSFAEAAPFGCAGVTVFNAIRGAAVAAGGRVAVFGLGGLGHLAVQFADRLGYETVVLARGSDRQQAARSLGADHYVDVTDADAGAALASLGGADLVLYTASDSAPAAQLVDGIRVGGRLVFVGVDGGSVDVGVGDLVAKGITVTGHLTGSPEDTLDAMRFAARTGIRPVIERFPLADAAVAVERLRAGSLRFRAVLEPAS